MHQRNIAVIGASAGDSSSAKARSRSAASFRCHTGHAHSAVNLEGDLHGKVEGVGWSAVRALQEHAMLLQEFARHPGYGMKRLSITAPAPK